MTVWCEHGCPKHVEDRNKHTRKRTVCHVGYLQRLYRDARSTEHKKETKMLVWRYFAWCLQILPKSIMNSQEFIYSYSEQRSNFLSLSLSLSLFLQRRYSPGWASASFRSFLHPSRFRATTFQFLHPSLATSSSTPSSQRSLGLPLGRFPPGSLRRTLLDRWSSWRMTCPAHLSLLNLQNFTLSFSPHRW